MALSIMVQGTTSNAGKTLTVAGLCRILKEDGYKVAPFKAQNLALNSYITDSGLEMGRAQVVQAEACGIKPDIRMNPILLKPSTNKGLQVILNGEVLPDTKAKELFANKHKLMEEVLKSYKSLADEYDIIVLEGAGSPAEINLKDNDIVNMNMAKASNSPVLIVGDIEKGGVFASLYGTIMLLDEDERDYVKGFIINKFRGDETLLSPALKMFNKYSDIPFVGVVPYIDVDIDEEDILSKDFQCRKVNALIDIAVLKLPKISNYTDFNNFDLMEDVSVRYIETPKDFNNPDLLIIPGTKSTIEDLLWLRNNGFEQLILNYAKEDKPIFGICGGFQILCKSIVDHHNVEFDGEILGFGLLDYTTTFTNSKVRTNKGSTLDSVTGIFKNLSNKTYDGYEVHMGKTNTEKNIVNNNNIYGTYIHGIFDKKEIVTEIIKALFNVKGIEYTNIEVLDYSAYKESQYHKLGTELRKSLDMDLIYKIINSGISS